MIRNIGIFVSPPRRSCEDKNCPYHGKLSVRGRVFSGTLVSAKARKMVVVEHQYSRPVTKYKRFERSKSKMHAYVPECMDVIEGKRVRIAECRPLTKTVAFVVIEVEQ
jgi:small subunit ribosomal protein S17